MSLLGTLEGFVGALREAGVPAGTSEVLDATRVLGAVDLLDRSQLRAGLAATLVKRRVHRPQFDLLFDLWFPPAVGDRVRLDGDPGGPDDAPPGEPDVQALRDQLRDLLLNGDDEALRRFAQLAVAQLGRLDTQPGRQSWFAYRVLRALSADTLIASLLDALLAGEPRGGMAEQVARQTLRERISALQEYVDAEVRRRVAEERDRDQVARTALRPLVDQVDFLRAQREELVVLCDVSGSVAGFAHFTLMLTAALREQFARVRAFAFFDTCDEVTRLFAPGADLADAVTRLSREADLIWYDGHSDYGHALEVFTERWPDAIGPKTSLLVLGDGRTNYRDPGLPLLKDLAEKSRHAYWLNPEPRRQWGSGDSAATRYGEVVEMVECRTVGQLADFVGRLLPG